MNIPSDMGLYTRKTDLATPLQNPKNTLFRWKKQAPQRHCQHTHINLKGIMFQRMEMFSSAIVRTSSCACVHHEGL
jgi:hypothetical protein